MFETIEVVRGSRVAVIWLNRPEVHNALNEVMVKELTQAIEASAHDEQINAIVLASRGDSFCSGTDLSWCRTALDGESGAAVMMTAALVGMLNAIETSPVPVIARVNGHCVGAGVGLVAAADIGRFIRTPDKVYWLIQNGKKRQISNLARYESLRAGGLPAINIDTYFASRIVTGAAAPAVLVAPTATPTPTPEGYVEQPVVDPFAPPAPTPTPFATPPPAPAAPRDISYGTPVPGKSGFVTSPHSPYAGYVDVRGFPPGTEVKCPYSGKIFLVP